MSNLRSPSILRQEIPSVNAQQKSDLQKNLLEFMADLAIENDEFFRETVLKAVHSEDSTLSDVAIARLLHWNSERLGDVLTYLRLMTYLLCVERGLDPEEVIRP